MEMPLKLQQPCSLRGLRHAPALFSLELWNEGRSAVHVPLAAAVWSGPSMLHSLFLGGFKVGEDEAPRALAKALFLRLPLLESFIA